MFRIFSFSQNCIRPSVAFSRISRQSSSAPPAMFQYPAPSSHPPSSGTVSSHRSSISQTRISREAGSPLPVGSVTAQIRIFDRIQGVQLFRSFRRNPIHQKSSVAMKGRRIRLRISSRIRSRIIGETASSRFPSSAAVNERIIPVWALNRSIYGFRRSGSGYSAAGGAPGIGFTL